MLSRPGLDRAALAPEKASLSRHRLKRLDGFDRLVDVVDRSTVVGSAATSQMQKRACDRARSCGPCGTRAALQLKPSHPLHLDRSSIQTPTSHNHTISQPIKPAAASSQSASRRTATPRPPWLPPGACRANTPSSSCRSFNDWTGLIGHPHHHHQTNPLPPTINIDRRPTLQSNNNGATGAGLSWGQLQQLDHLSLSASANTAVTAASSDSTAQPISNTHAPLEDDARSVGSRLSNAGSTFSAATFYSFSTSNYSGFAGAGELARGMGVSGGEKRHYVHPQDLDPNAIYDVDWVQGESAA